jgi:hypothetical protein
LEAPADRSTIVLSLPGTRNGEKYGEESSQQMGAGTCSAGHAVAPAVGPGGDQWRDGRGWPSESDHSDADAIRRTDYSVY